jgi:hypothetical protein
MKISIDKTLDVTSLFVCIVNVFAFFQHGNKKLNSFRMLISRHLAFHFPPFIRLSSATIQGHDLRKYLPFVIPFHQRPVLTEES